MTIRESSLMPALLALSACGLSKEDAREIIRAKHYAKDDSVYCTWNQVLDKKEQDIYDARSGQTACVDALEKVSLVKRAPCVDTRTLEVVRCDENLIRLNADKAKLVDDGTKVQFACGRKKLGEVISVATEGSKAKVRYNRFVELDGELLNVLQACTLGVPAAGDQEQKVTLLKDDDGRWSVE